MSVQGISSIGILLQVNDVNVNYVQDIGDIGGTPSTLDATCLGDMVKKSVAGVQELPPFEVSYLFDNSSATSDFRRLKNLQSTGNVYPISVTFPDGTSFTSTGYINTYVIGAKVDELITAKLIATLQSNWVITNPTSLT